MARKSEAEQLAEFLTNVTLTDANGVVVRPGAAPLEGALTMVVRKGRHFAGDRKAILARLAKANPGATITWGD